MSSGSCFSPAAHLSLPQRGTLAISTAGCPGSRFRAPSRDPGAQTREPGHVLPREAAAFLSRGSETRFRTATSRPDAAPTGSMMWLGTESGVGDPSSCRQSRVAAPSPELWAYERLLRFTPAAFSLTRLNGYLLLLSSKNSTLKKNSSGQIFRRLHKRELATGHRTVR